VLSYHEFMSDLPRLASIGMGKEFAPSAYDELAPAIIALQKRAEPPREPQGALHEPRNAGQVRGDPLVYVMRVTRPARRCVQFRSRVAPRLFHIHVMRGQIDLRRTPTRCE
jgi:hypothetical protein